MIKEQLEELKYLIPNKLDEAIYQIINQILHVVDEKASSVTTNNNEVVVNIISKNNIYCPFRISFYDLNKKPRYQLCAGKDWRISEDVIEESETKKDIIDSLQIFFLTRIDEELTYVGNALKKAKYIYVENNSLSLKYYRGYSGVLLPWSRKRKEINVYRSWR